MSYTAANLQGASRCYCTWSSNRISDLQPDSWLLVSVCSIVCVLRPLWSLRHSGNDRETCEVTSFIHCSEWGGMWKQKLWPCRLLIDHLIRGWYDGDITDLNSLCHEVLKVMRWDGGATLLSPSGFISVVNLSGECFTERKSSPTKQELQWSCSCLQCKHKEINTRYLIESRLFQVSFHVSLTACKSFILKPALSKIRLFFKL